MSNQPENSSTLLSLALFRKLYDEKQDIYEIISSFIRHELSNGMVEFSLTEISQTINSKYNFDIPEQVIKTSLHRLKRSNELKIDNHKYIKLGNIKLTDIKRGLDDLATTQEKDIIKILSEYTGIAEKNISNNEIKKSLECFILNKTDKCDISSYINSCIIANEQDIKFIDGLNSIKQGLVLYESISYGIESINPKNWNIKTIFLDTEILFYLASYHGILFKKMVDDFLSLIITVNKDKKIVRLRFSEKIKNEVDSFFDIAELIIDGKRTYQQNDVIKYILEHCASSSEIVEKKVDFYSLLRRNKITEYENQTIYNEENHGYNIEGDTDIDNIGEKHLQQLNLISVLRQGNIYKTLEKVEFLLLTATENTIYLSNKSKDKKDFPLALRLFDLTNQLWIKVNKGLGNKKLPSTFDVRNRAKIALSSSLAKKVSEEYDKVKNDYSNREIDKDSFIEKISDLRKIKTGPDDINISNCEEINDLITDPDSIERHYAEKAMYKKESEDKDVKLREKDDEINRLQEENTKIINIAVSIVVIIVVALLLFYFNDDLILFWKVVLYVIGVLVGFVFPTLNFFDINFTKIKYWINTIRRKK